MDPDVAAIARDARCRNRPVVLCEGDTPARRWPGQRPSPSSHKQCARLPDADFYRQCVPKSWRMGIPAFRNCGGRADVLRTMRGLLDLAETAPGETFVDAERLFALVDLDLQAQALDGPIGSIAELHHALYDPPSPGRRVRLRRPIDRRHRVWVTALIHKEAFFIAPSMQAVLEGAGGFTFDGAAGDVRAMCAAAGARLDPGSVDRDREVEALFAGVCARLGPCAASLGLDLADPGALAASWRAADRRSPGDEALFDALFLVTKAKPLWARVGPPLARAWTRGDAAWRDQLERAVARHIAGLAPHAHPIAGFIDGLRHGGWCAETISVR